MNTSLRNIYVCFPQGRHKVLTMSFDDGRIEDRELVRIFNQYAIKGTFHLNSGLQNEERIPAGEWKTLYEGHEVSCHTVLHPTIARSPIQQTALQVLEDRRALEEAVGYPVRGLSYPNGSYTREIAQLLPKLGIEYARLVGGSGGFGMPDDYLMWKPTCHHTHRLMEIGERFVELHKRQYLYMMYVWGHSYEFTNDGNWALIEEFCRLTGSREDIWYATNIEIVDYMKAADNLKFTVQGDKVYNPGSGSIWIQVGETVAEIPGGRTVHL